MKKFKNVLIVLIVIVIAIVLIVNLVKSRIQAVVDSESSFSNYLFDSYTVSRSDVTSYARSSGNITSFNIETLKLETGDQIKEILVSEGEKVEANQTVMKIVNDGKEKNLKSTISGLFFCVESSTGETEYCIYNLDDVGVKVTFSEKDIANITIGQKAVVNIPALDKELEGTVSYISNLPQNERYTVRVKLDYSDDIKFGYSSSVSIVTMEKTNAIIVPYDYVSMTDDGKYYVIMDEYKDELYDSWLQSDNVNISEEKRTYIKPGIITSKTIEVLEGLEENQTIIKFNSDW
jgi:multidrug efflux pump subunit AcrA (membrane-fusion protein)